MEASINLKNFNPYCLCELLRLCSEIPEGILEGTKHICLIVCEVVSWIILVFNKLRDALFKCPISMLFRKLCSEVILVLVVFPILFILN